MSDDAPKTRVRVRPKAPVLSKAEKQRTKAKLQRERKRLLKRNLWRQIRKWRPDLRPTEQIVTEACPTRFRAQYHVYLYDTHSYKSLRGQYITFVCRTWREFDRLTKAIAKLTKSKTWSDEHNLEEIEHGAHAVPRDDDRRVGDGVESD